MNKILYLLSALTLSSGHLQAQEFNSSAIQFSKLSGAEKFSHFFDGYIAPNTVSPKFDVGVHYISEEGFSVLRAGKAEVEIPQISQVIIQLEDYVEKLTTKTTLTLGPAKNEASNVFINASVDISGSDGAFGNNAELNVNFSRKNLKSEQFKNYHYNVTLDTVLGKFYFQFNSVTGTGKLNYREVLCATTLYKDANCDPNFIGNRKLGSTFKKDKVKYEIEKKHDLESIDYHLEINYHLLQGSKDLQHQELLSHRKFIPEKTNIRGRLCIIQDKNCRTGFEVLLNQILLNKILM